MKLKISKAVEVEVARRLEEHERRRRAEEKEVGQRSELQVRSEGSIQESLAESDVSASSSHPAPNPLPSGVLTPLLKRHEDLDSELKRRLMELEER